jgi:hypothetical protein
MLQKHGQLACLTKSTLLATKNTFYSDAGKNVKKFFNNSDPHRRNDHRHNSGGDFYHISFADIYPLRPKNCMAGTR